MKAYFILNTVIALCIVAAGVVIYNGNESARVSLQVISNVLYLVGGIGNISLAIFADMKIPLRLLSAITAGTIFGLGALLSEFATSGHWDLAIFATFFPFGLIPSLMGLWIRFIIRGFLF